MNLCAHDVHERPVGGGAAYVIADEVDSYHATIAARGYPGVTVIPPGEEEDRLGSLPLAVLFGTLQNGGKVVVDSDGTELLLQYQG